ncbi:MAG: IclR family transcriptional regulator [Deltaproteobacteria bacterium]|nr:IclR family transcriptional regulator [Deltaproteobacteria bacterium]
MTEKYKAPAVKKAFQILKFIADSDRGLGISELAKSLEMAKGTVHGITSILEELGAIARDPATKRYELGLTLFELGRQAYSQIDLRKIARPVMEELMEKVQETVFFGVMNREHVTILEIVECGHDLKITAPVGTIIPLFVAATGKVFLAGLDENEAIKIIDKKGLPRHTDKSITDPKEFFEEIRKVRQRGYATDIGEYVSGLRAIAAPIKGESGQLAAIWVVGFKASLDEGKMRLLKKEIRVAVDAINQRIREQSKL